jgi:hypothetical protein
MNQHDILVYMQALGACIMVAGGLLLASVLLYIGYKVLGVVGQLFFNRVVKVYHVSHLHYWMDRMEKEGTHCFQRSIDEVKESKNND